MGFVAFFILVLVFVIKLWRPIQELRSDDDEFIELDEDEPGRFDGYRRLTDFPEDIQLHRFLSASFSYYLLLSSDEQSLFRLRLTSMLKTKWFAGREGVEVTDSMILLIGATMIQITFGINRFYFPRFSRIVIFPDVFYSRLFEQDVRGMTIYHTGIILISWPHFEYGVSNDSDKINLGLHELAHALYLDYFEHRRMLYGFDEWTRLAEPIFMEMQRNQGHPFLRAYAGRNIHEFWSVSVEHFFEAPFEFRERLPGLYRAMCKILRQDVAARVDEYNRVQARRKSA